MGRKYLFGYGSEELYFVTCTCIRWIDMFTRDRYRHIITDSLKYSQDNNGLVIYAWVLMTNHLHLIVRQSGATPIGKILGEFKSFTSKQVKKNLQTDVEESRRDWLWYMFERAGIYNANNLDFQLWQQDGSHPVLLDTREKLFQRLYYTHQNPVRAGFVTEAEHWRWSSAVDYCGGEGILKGIQLIEQ